MTPRHREHGPIGRKARIEQRDKLGILQTRLAIRMNDRVLQSRGKSCGDIGRILGVSRREDVSAVEIRQNSSELCSMRLKLVRFVEIIENLAAVLGS